MNKLILSFLTMLCMTSYSQNIFKYKSVNGCETLKLDLKVVYTNTIFRSHKLMFFVDDSFKDVDYVNIIDSPQAGQFYPFQLNYTPYLFESSSGRLIKFHLKKEHQIDFPNAFITFWDSECVYEIPFLSVD